MTVEVLSPQKIIYKGFVKSGQFPGTKGILGILKDHAPIISTLGKGNIILKEEDDSEKNIEVHTFGIIEVDNNKIIVLLED